MSVGAPILLAARQISRRTSSRDLVAQATMWKASAHRVAFGHRSPTTVAIHSAASADTSFTSWDRPSPSRSKNCSRVTLSRPGGGGGENDAVCAALSKGVEHYGCKQSCDKQKFHFHGGGISR